MSSRTLVRLSAIALFGIGCFARFALADSSLCTQFSINLAEGVSTDFSEVPSEDCVLVTIKDVTWTNTVNVEFLSGNTLSDKIVFGNNTLNQATICFESDKEPEASFSQNCQEFAHPDLMLSPQETNNTFSLNAVAPDGTVDARIDLFSEPENSTSGISDELNVVPLAPAVNRNLKVTPIPEPASFPVIALIGALAALRRFGRHHSLS
jgi:hypothetical protein